MAGKLSWLAFTLTSIGLIAAVVAILAGLSGDARTNGDRSAYIGRI